jgi:hypothetical protein
MPRIKDKLYEFSLLNYRGGLLQMMPLSDAILGLNLQKLHIENAAINIRTFLPVIIDRCQNLKHLTIITNTDIEVQQNITTEWFNNILPFVVKLTTFEILDLLVNIQQFPIILQTVSQSQIQNFAIGFSLEYNEGTGVNIFTNQMNNINLNNVGKFGINIYFDPFGENSDDNIHIVNVLINWIDNLPHLSTLHLETRNDNWDDPDYEYEIENVISDFFIKISTKLTDLSIGFNAIETSRFSDLLHNIPSLNLTVSENMFLWDEGAWQGDRFYFDLSHVYSKNLINLIQKGKKNYQHGGNGLFFRN